MRSAWRVPSLPALGVWLFSRERSRASSLACASAVVAAFGCAGLRAPAPEGRAAPATAAPLPGAIHAMAEAKLGALTIRKWRLDSGLEIVTTPDPSARAVSYVTAFRVGSRNEDASQGETGLAHLFEHLMFTGASGQSAEGDFDRRIEEVGGSGNASTDYDATWYVDNLPPDAIERAIHMEADRLGNLNLGADRVARERNVVIEERLATLEDSVDGLLDAMMHEQAFRAHPYRWPVIGRRADVEAVTKEQALAFYRRNYGVDRAVIVVAGRFDERAVLTAIEQAYRKVAPAADAAPRNIAPERAPAMTVRSAVQKPVVADRLGLGFPAPGLVDPDHVAYEVLFELLAGGPSSRLYRNLVVDRALASSIVGDPSRTLDPGLGIVWVQMVKGHEAREGEDLVVTEIERTLAAPPAAEIAAARNRLLVAAWGELASSDGRAEELARFEVTTGDFRTLGARLEAVGRVGEEDVRRVGRLYLAGARSVAVAQAPAGKAEPR